MMNVLMRRRTRRPGGRNRSCLTSAIILTDTPGVCVTRACAGSLAPGWLAIGGSTAATPNWDTFPLCTIITVTFLFPGVLWLNMRTALHSLLERRAIEPHGPYRGECVESPGDCCCRLDTACMTLLVKRGVQRT